MPIAAPAKLPLTEMGRDTFDHWLKLFRATVDDRFAVERAEHIKNCAADMANVIYSKINAVPDPRFDPANLTPEHSPRACFGRWAADSPVWRSPVSFVRSMSASSICSTSSAPACSSATGVI
jgi:hemoglobin